MGPIESNIQAFIFLLRQSKQETKVALVPQYSIPFQWNSTMPGQVD